MWPYGVAYAVTCDAYVDTYRPSYEVMLHYEVTIGDYISTWRIIEAHTGLPIKWHEVICKHIHLYFHDVLDVDGKITMVKSEVKINPAGGVRTTR